jgi:pyridoxal 5'-phosphate synthase pdxS subunit
MHEIGTMRVKSGLAEMLKGGVIMDVVDAEQAKIAEEAGACAVMALERVPADIRRDGGVARMSDPDMIKGIQEAVTIPVMAKCRIGHFAEAQILQSLEIDYIDESEVLTPADLEHHVDKWQFTIPFVCGCTNLGEALRRIAEGAAMIRTKGEAGTGDIVNAVTHMRSVFGGIRRLQSLRSEELYSEAKNLQAPYELVKWVAENGRLPVVTFTAGGIATPADASLCMQLGADGVFVGSGIFKSGNPSQRARAIVEATTHYMDADVLARVSAGLGEAMVGISTQSLDPSELLEWRGWWHQPRRPRVFLCLLERAEVDDDLRVLRRLRSAERRLLDDLAGLRLRRDRVLEVDQPQVRGVDGAHGFLERLADDVRHRLQRVVVRAS